MEFSKPPRAVEEGTWLSMWVNALLGAIGFPLWKRPVTGFTEVLRSTHFGGKKPTRTEAVSTGFSVLPWAKISVLC